MVATILKFALSRHHNMADRGAKVLRLALAGLMLLIGTGCGSALLSESGYLVSRELSEEELTDEVFLASGEQRTLRRSFAVSGKVVATSSKRGKFSREAALPPRAGHTFANGLCAPLRC